MLQCTAAFHGLACQAAPVHLCRRAGDFSGDTVADHLPLSQLTPPCIKLVSNISNYSHIYPDKVSLIGPWGPCEVMACGSGLRGPSMRDFWGTLLSSSKVMWPPWSSSSLVTTANNVIPFPTNWDSVVCRRGILDFSCLKYVKVADFLCVTHRPFLIKTGMDSVIP